MKNYKDSQLAFSHFNIQLTTPIFYFIIITSIQKYNKQSFNFLLKKVRKHADKTFPMYSFNFQNLFDQFLFYRWLNALFYCIETTYIQKNSMKKTETYCLTLIQGDYFNVPKEQFFKSLYSHFSLLSWLNSVSEVNIHNKEKFYPEGKQISVYTFSTAASLKETYLVQFDKNEKEKSISYCSFDDRQAMLKAVNGQKLKQKVLVVFSMHEETSKLDKSKKRAVIYIDITDDDGFFKCGVKRVGMKLSQKTDKSKPNVIHYPYKEPLSRRNKESPECHFNLAFQGGGAKGVSYVGVYKALKELHSSIPISSVIGSSAGGILALAISSGMTPSDISDLCLQMDAIPKNKYFCNESEITPEKQKEFDGLIFKLKSLLHNYGIVEGTMFDQFTDSFCDIETDNKILKVLQCINPSIAELFSIQLKEPFTVSKGFFAKPQIYTRRLNYYGILMAGMMKGDAVENIAASCLVDFIQKHYENDYLKANPLHKARVPTITRIINKWGFNQIDDDLFEKDQFRAKVKTLTLKEYYAISGIEFTCTSVDLDDQILRFFNHKTTPDLPVCKTVQMTGSFPVAFQAQRWQKEWGKYFVHYENFRKEIDLTGHEFTDGGLLANFPIKYLDNEHMRPMYFSHRQKPDKTILYGFGLDQIADPQQDDKEKQLEKNLAIEELKQHLKGKFSKLRFIKNLILSNSKQQLPLAQMEQIPLFNFVLKLLRTFTVADYNLNMECFEKSIIETEVEARVIQECKNVKNQIRKFEAFDQHLENLHIISKSKQKALPNQVLHSTCQRLKQCLNDFQNTENYVIERVKSQALDSLYNYEGGRIRNRFSESREVTALIKSLETLYPQGIFKMQSSTAIKAQLFQIIQQIQQYFQGLKGSLLGELTIVYSGMLETQLQTISRIRSRLCGILSDLRNISTPHIESKEYAELTFIDYQLVFDLISMERKFFIVDQDYLKQTMHEIKKLQLPVISIDKEILDNASKMQYELNSILQNGKSNRLHLVMQSKQNSSLYYCGLYSILQEVLNHTHNQDKKIQMITCSDFHSVFAFLLAGGKKINNIRKEMWRVKDLIGMEDDIQQEYSTFKWAQTYSQEMNELLDLTWQDQYKLFDNVEQYLNDIHNNQLRNQIRQMKIQYLYSKDTVTKAMENVLSYVLDSAKEAQKIKDQRLRKKKLAQLLSLRNGYKGKDYTQKNKKISKNTQRIINKLMFHFEQLITYVILNNYLIPSAFQQFSPQKRQQVWKGVLIKKLLSSKKLQLYLKEKLEEMKLNSNTSLAQFFQFSPRKITLNFALINKKQQRLEIVNRFTKPNMPLWAAIIASTSMPYLLPPFACNQEWEFSPYTDSRMRKMVNYFFDQDQNSIQTFYIAGNYVSTLPLEFLTNEKIARENYTSIKNHEELIIKANQLTKTTTSDFLNEIQAIRFETDFTCITFSFRKKTANQQSYKYQKKDKHFLTFSNLLNIGLDFLMGRFKNIEVGFKDILRRVQILKLLQTRIQCHDNTIMHYYKDQTIKLPVRLGTLDFYKIEKSKQEYLNSCIYQAQFVVRGIFENLHIHKDKKGFNYQSKKETYLQFKTREDKTYIQFPSKSKWNKKLSTMYRIFYRLNSTQKYVEYEEEPITFSIDQEFLYLKFIFPNMNTMRLQQQQMEVDFKRLIQNQEFEQNLIFRFNYETAQKKYLKGIKLDNNKLKTRILPSIKSIGSQHGVELSATHLVKATSIAARTKESQWNEKEGATKCLIIKTIVSFKHNGLVCKCCTHHLRRTPKINSSNELPSGKCGRCKNTFNIIGLECLNGSCTQREQNRYCFQCLLVYLIHRKEGQYSCTTEGHQFKHCSTNNNSSISICHFCCSAASDYYKDEECNINLCFKCSLILDSKGAIAV